MAMRGSRAVLAGAVVLGFAGVTVELGEARAIGEESSSAMMVSFEGAEVEIASNQFIIKNTENSSSSFAIESLDVARVSQKTLSESCKVNDKGSVGSV